MAFSTLLLSFALASQPGARPWQREVNPTSEPGTAGGMLQDDGPDDDSDLPESPEAESAQVGGPSDGGLLYSGELSDADLEKKFLSDLPSLGSISVGFAEAGRLINGVQLAPGDAWTVVAPECAWGTQETVDALTRVAAAVRERRPGIGPLRVNHIGKQEGGYLKPHQSHQSGRDVDLGFFYLGGAGRVIDLGANWQLLKAVATLSDAQLVLVDKRVQKMLSDYALATGEDKAFVDSLFHAGKDSLVQHARRHRDHFHVRFFAPRAQELGRRIQPLLAMKPEENLTTHRVKKGDTLGHIAVQYGSTVKLIQKANGLTNSFLSLGRTLKVPLRGPCTKCPLPPPMVVPPRRTAPPMQG